ncbi:MAG: 3-hydroxyacyl-CoA dehydrogenase NAD-binding domain-containing protein, partial [Thermoleophilia bacterium]
IDRQLTRMVEKGKLGAQDKEQAMRRLRGSTRLEDAADADLIIEAIIENLDDKNRTYSRLDELCKPGTIFASNTSSLSITQMMTATGQERQRRFIGMHFFNPVPVMKLVEIVRTILTEPEVFQEATAFARDIGKVPVQTSDRTGFIVNRLLVPYMLDAIRALEEGVGSIVDIDTAMKLGTNVPMGPLALADFIGLDTCLSVMQVLHEGLADSKYRPCPLLVKYVEAGWLGRKTQRGFYDYRGAKPMPTR